MINLKRTDSTNQHFINLVQQLDADLAVRDGSEHAFYNQFNKIDVIKHVVVAYENEEPVGCGALKEFDANRMEVKRMYTLPNSRGKGIATIVLAELEKWAAESLYTTCLLETGKKQPEAIAVYRRNGYTQIDNYGQYAGVENSLCFEKELSYESEMKNRIATGLTDADGGHGISFNNHEKGMEEWKELNK